MKLDDFYLVQQPGRCYLCGAGVDAVSGINVWEAAENWLEPTAVCLACAVGGFVGQVATPGDCAFGLFHGAAFPVADAVALTLLYSSASFWSGVWQSRVEANPDGGEPRRPEDVTAVRLAEIGQLFDGGDWARGAELLEPVANRWLQEGSDALWCWRKDNQQNVNLRWHQLKSHLFALLPESVRLLADCRRHAWRHSQSGCVKKIWDWSYE